MFVASSLRYGGMLVSSENCDHKSYLSLGLVCCNCQRPVFYVEGFDRKGSFRASKEGEKIPIKASKIPAHFRHFKEVPGELVEQCEARVKTISKRQIKDSQAKFKRQRRKLFDKRIIDLIKFNPRLTNYDWLLLLAETDFFTYLGKYGNSSKFKSKDAFFDASIKKVKRSLVDNFKQSRSELYAELGEALNAMKKDDFDPYASEDNVLAHLEYLKSPLEYSIHQKISYEVLDYLLLGLDRDSLGDLLFYHYYLAKVCTTPQAMFAETERQKIDFADIKGYIKDFEKFFSFVSTILTEASFMPIERLAGIDGFTEIAAQREVFITGYLQESQKRADPDITQEMLNLCHQQSNNALLTFMVTAIADTPWVEAFQWFDKNLMPTKKVFNPQKLLLIDGTKKDIETCFVNLRHEQISNAPSYEVARGIEFNRSTTFQIHNNSGKGYFDVEVSLELGSVADRFCRIFITIKDKETQPPLCRGFGWTKIAHISKDPLLRMVKRDYPEIHKDTLERIKNFPCFFSVCTSPSQEQELRNHLIWTLNICLHQCSLKFAL